MSLAFVLLLCAPPLISGQSKPLPSVYIQMDFKFTWKEFCLLKTYFQTKISELIVQKNGDLITLSQVHLNNFEENCPAARNNTEKASLLFYIIKSGGSYQDVDKELTRHTFEVLYYLVENKLGRLIGPLFELKIDSVEAKGADAPPMPTGFTEMERTYIALGIAVGILAILICILIVVYYTKQHINRKRNPPKHTTGEENKGLEVIQSQPQNANKPYPVNEEAAPSAAETKF